VEEEILTLEPERYKQWGAPFPLQGNVEIRGSDAIRLGGGVRLEYPKRMSSAVGIGIRLAEEIKASLTSTGAATFDEELKSLRGRLWSS